MRILITGSDGFLGKNLQLRLRERNDLEILTYTHADSFVDLPLKLENVDFVFHLAGVNRSLDSGDYAVGNEELTKMLCKGIHGINRKMRVLYASSIQASLDNPYGKSKRLAEIALKTLSQNDAIDTIIFRLPNVFGKWCKPNYNSVVATFCHNIARDLPIQIHDADAKVKLVYVDDVLDRFIELMDGADSVLDSDGFEVVTPQYTVTVGDLALQIKKFHNSRISLTTERVGTGFLRALYATYVSYLPIEEFSYRVPVYEDARGIFVEMLKTPDCGQISFFTAYPGVIRGGHYHHSKTEKFLVIKGHACFRFKHMASEETYQIEVSGDYPKIVETIPGWAHDIINIGSEDMIVMLWANEIFNQEYPDTYAYTLK